jgi:hypothetical protein
MESEPVFWSILVHIMEVAARQHATGYLRGL